MCRALFFLLLFGLVSCQHSGGGDCPSGVQSPEGCQPFKLGVLLMNPQLDAKKPIASKNWGGYVLAEDLLIGAYDDQWLGAYSMKTNSYKWWLKIDSPIASPINLIGSWVVFSQRNGKILKVESLTGKEVWSLDLGFFSQQEFVLGGQTLLVPTIDNKLFGVDFLRGAKKWLHDGGASRELSIQGAPRPRVWSSRVVMSTSHGELHILDLESGGPLSKISPQAGDYRFRDVVGEIGMESSDFIFSRYDGVATRVSLLTGRPVEKWHRTFPSISTSKYVQGVFYLGCVNGRVYALDGVSGDVLWEAQTVEPVSSFVVGSKNLLVAGSNGLISSLKNPGGELIWHDRLSASLISKPLRFGDTIYYSTGLKALYGYRVF